MNLVGKILTVLILVMSLVFATIAVTVYATHTNWRDVVLRSPEQTPRGEESGLKFQLDEADAENDDLKNQVKKRTDELSMLKATRQDELIKLENQRDELRRERDTREKELQDLNKDKREAIATMKAMQGTLADLRTERTTLRQRADKAERDCDEQFKRVVAVTDTLHQAENRVKLLETRQLALVADLNRYRDLLRAHDVNPAEDPKAALPKVDGVVLALSGGGVIEISIGEDDGLKKGHQLEVYRAKSYLGRVEVLRTAPDKAVCKIIPEHRKGAIRVGDLVASKLE